MCLPVHTYKGSSGLRSSVAGLMLQVLCSVPEASIPTCSDSSWLPNLPLLSGLEHGLFSVHVANLPGPWGSGFCSYTRPVATLLKVRFTFTVSFGNLNFCLVMVVFHAPLPLCCQDHSVVLELPVISGISSAGDDKYGRKVILFSACRMPPSHQLDHVKLLG